MTRINAGIPPRELSGKHLIAEHREIKRIPNVVRSGRFSMKGQPEQFTLGQGHVKFFYDKLGYLKQRYEEIHIECVCRGFNVQDYSGAWNDVPKEMMKDWIPTPEAAQLIRERIESNNLKSKRP